MNSKFERLMEEIGKLPANKQKQLIQNFIHQTKVKSKLYNRYLDKVTDN